MNALFAPIADLLERLKLNFGIPLVIIGVVCLYFIFQITGVLSNTVVSWLIALSPIWLPIFSFYLFYEKWLQYVQLHNRLKQPRIVLKINLPQEITKPPSAMEMVLGQIWASWAADNLIETYWDGKHPPITTLELVSRGGAITFYVTVLGNKMRNQMEAQLYAQYPRITIEEVPIDYTAEIPWDPENYEYFSMHMGKKKESVLPIKTYYDFELNKNPKEEEKVDPITATLDHLASIGPNEHLWVQFVMRGHGKQNFKTASLKEKPTWEADARTKVNEIMKRNPETGDPLQDEDGGMHRISRGEQETVEAIERNTGKYAFDVGIRWMYIAKKGYFKPGERIGPTIGSFRQYDMIGRNQIGMRWRTDFDWSMIVDRSGKRVTAWKKKELADYKKRKYNARADMSNDGRADDMAVYSIEELATMFHLPGAVALTPSLGRIESTRREAPPNLPIG